MESPLIPKDSLSNPATRVRLRGCPGAVPQYSKPLPPMNSRRIDVGGTWSG